MRGIQYYIPNNVSVDENTVLISGQCVRIKALYLAEQLKQAASARCKAVVIDFGRTGDFSSILDSCGFHQHYVFVTGRDNYAPNETPIREAISNLRTHARRLGYEHSSYAQMTAFLGFLMNLDSGNCSSVQQLLREFSNQEKLEKLLLMQVKTTSQTSMTIWFGSGLQI